MVTGCCSQSQCRASRMAMSRPRGNGILAERSCKTVRALAWKRRRMLPKEHRRRFAMARSDWCSTRTCLLNAERCRSDLRPRRFGRIVHVRRHTEH